MAVVGSAQTGTNRAARRSGLVSAELGWRARSLWERFDRRYVGGLLALVVLYYGAAQVGYELEFAGPVAAILWLPVGVGIAFLYLGGLRFWPALIVGDLLVNDYSALPTGSAIGQTCGNLLEVLVATMLLRRLIHRGSPLGSAGNLTRTLLAIGAGTALSATIGGISLWLGAVVSASELPNVWRTWWLGDSVGALIVVPLALAWARPLLPRPSRARLVEGALMLATVCALSALAVRGGHSWTYVVFPALLWAALRFGPAGATLAITLAVGFTVWETTHYVGAFVSHSVDHSVLTTQLYIGVGALSALYLAAVVSEREAFAGQLAASRTRLVEAADMERRRLAHDLHDGAQGRLTALLVRIGALAPPAEAAHGQRPEPAAALLEEARRELAEAIEELRALAHGIQPRVLAEQGLASAIRSFAERWSIPIDPLELTPRRFDATTEATAYYVFAEALTNAHKHARASSLKVRTRATSEGLRVEIVDDGIGGATGGGFGLRGLRDRVEALGGSFEIDSPVGRGTRIAAEIPGMTV
jgi:signal transduction histidine kinase